MDTLFSKYDFFQLLGLSSLDDEKKNSYVQMLSKVALQKSIKDIALSAPNSQDLDPILEQLSTSTLADSESLQNKLVSKFPQLPDMLASQINMLKRDALLKQIGDFIKFVKETKTELLATSPVDTEQMNTLIDKISSNSNDGLDDLLTTYQNLKVKYNFVSK